MNQKITMSSLVALLALKSGLSKDKSEEFLKEFFKLISENLRQGESVRLKSLGTFKIGQGNVSLLRCGYGEVDRVGEGGEKV